MECNMHFEYFNKILELYNALFFENALKQYF